MSQKIIVIGCGFAGLRLVQQLNNNKKYSITVIDKVNHHSFQPLFYQVASGRLESSNIAFPFRKIFQRSKNIKFAMTEITKVLPESNKVITSDAEFQYDMLVIATGCRTNFYGNEDIAKHSFGMKSVAEAETIRNHILMTFEKVNIKRERSDLGDANIVIVGGGATGVELAGAFAEMKKNVLPRDYPNEDISRLQIILVNAKDKTLTSMSENAQNKSTQYLMEMGVTLKNNAKVDAYDGQWLTFEDGEKIASTNVIWAAGVTGSIIEGMNPDNIVKNRYLVNEFNQVKGYDNIYAIGDISCMESEENPHGHPQMASVAIQQGSRLGKNLKIKDKSKWKPFKYLDKGTMATVGEYKAVVDLSFWKFSGILAWFCWMFLHLMLILSIRNKLAIFFNWAWAFFNKDSSLRLIIVPKDDLKDIK